MKKTQLSKYGYILPKERFINDIEKIKKELTVEPFQSFTIGKTEKISFEVFLENDDYLFVPKYYGLKKFGKPEKNRELEGSSIDINFKGDLRPKQKEILDIVIPHINENDGGVLVLPCAAGKTVFSLYLACHYKIKTLVIVHKTFLLNQWKERAEEFTNAKVGIIQQDKIDIKDKDIVIGMLQSIAKEKYDDSIFKDFGLVIFDEAHHAPSQYFSKALPLIACKKNNKHGDFCYNSFFVLWAS
jgi:superfamily II DNA or RNA helicase